jgi:MFS superfamily sulfate permease-like transporter
MTHDLLHGELGAAVVDNVFLLVALPLIALWVILRRRRRLPVWPVPAVAVLVVAAVAWTVVRNLPGFPLVPTLLGG